MGIDAKELGQRLKQMREANQITQEEAAKALRVSRTKIAQIEAGNRPINTTQLETLAQLFKRAVTDFFAPAPMATTAPAVFFRIAEELRHEVKPAAVKPYLEVLREFTRLENLLGLEAKSKYPPQYDVTEPRSVWEAIEAGEKIAEEERQRLQLGTYPVRDIAELLETQGIRVLTIPMDEQISGVFMGDEEIGLAIFANPEHHPIRHSFTLAHEYCHILTDRDRRTVVSSEKNEKDLVEVRANAFAAAFLLPKAGVVRFFEASGKTGYGRNYLATPGVSEISAAEQRKPLKAAQIQLYDIVHLQNHYGVSWEAAVYRLQNVGLISKDECQDLIAKKEEASQIGRAMKATNLEIKGERKPRDFNIRFLCLALDAYYQELISRRKLEELADMVGLTRENLQKILSSAAER